VEAYVLVVVDQREAVCYAEFHAGQCHKPLVGNYVLKADCCCSIGAAWADDCQFCPRPSTGLSLSLSVSVCLCVCLHSSGLNDMCTFHFTVDVPVRHSRCRNDLLAVVSFEMGSQVLPIN